MVAKLASQIPCGRVIAKGHNRIFPYVQIYFRFSAVCSRSFVPRHTELQDATEENFSSPLCFPQSSAAAQKLSRKNSASRWYNAAGFNFPRAGTGALKISIQVLQFNGPAPSTTLVVTNVNHCETIGKLAPGNYPNRENYGPGAKLLHGAAAWKNRRCCCKLSHTAARQRAANYASLRYAF